MTRKNIIQKVPIVSRHAYSFWSEIFFPFSFFGAFCACRFLIFLVSNICFRRTTHFLLQSDMTRRPCEGLRAKQTCDSFSHASRPKRMSTKVETMENYSRECRNGRKSRAWFPTNSEQPSNVFFQPLLTRNNIIQKVTFANQHVYSFWSEFFFPFTFFGAFCACRFLIFLVLNICFRRTKHFLPQIDMTRRPCEGLRAKQTCESLSHASRPGTCLQR